MTPLLLPRLFLHLRLHLPLLIIIQNLLLPSFPSQLFRSPRPQIPQATSALFRVPTKENNPDKGVQVCRRVIVDITPESAPATTSPMSFGVGTKIGGEVVEFVDEYFMDFVRFGLFELVKSDLNRLDEGAVEVS